MFTFLLGSQPGSSISSYMAQMDKELATTSVGNSFIKKSSKDNVKMKVCIYLIFLIVLFIILF